jgi:hypothetical protein
MAVGKSLTYTDNQVLSTEGHNKNVYDADGNTGIMSESNGGLGANNLDSNFVAHAEHVFPETVAFGRQEYMTDAVQCFSDAFGSDQTTTANVIGTDVNQQLIRPVPGCGLRVYLPYDASAVLWQVSYFVNPQMWWCVAHDFDPPSYIDHVEFNAFTALKRDGVLLESTIRALPPSLFYAKDRAQGGTAVGRVTSMTARASMWRDLHYLDTDSNYLTKGWHDIQLCLHVEDPRTSLTIEDEGSNAVFTDDNQLSIKLVRPAGTTNPASTMANAAVFGIRNARALVLY